MATVLLMEEIKVAPKAYGETIKRGKIIHKSLHRCKKDVTWPNAGDVRRIVAMSDIHGATTEVVHSLIHKRKIIDKDTIVICTGDMGGADGKMGGLLDPTKDYCAIKDACRAFYFVQGNHDLDVSAVHNTWTNEDGTPCYLHRKVVDTAIGRIGGVSGIIVAKGKVAIERAHIYTEEDYDAMLQEVLQQKPEILLTHTPLESNLGVSRHLFGHAHFEEYIGLGEDGSLSLNMDRRIFVW